ncbi:putative carboxypeptidase RC0549 [Folsomia candida]|uniref:putative carboxypeptidase RC0549 n=1 Tax=Folsomia candida TaxID=158441 RepID=UPI000B8F863C|nr:putative carboxypeptidase RC0549 [Folsomia candida]
MASNSIKLAEGDLVRIVASAGKGSAANLPVIKAYVESLGLVADISPDIYNPDEPFYSNTDDFRAADLISALTNDECKAIWCIRGGSGCIRLIKYLESQLPPTPPSPKVLIGYSDITVLHMYLHYKYNWPTMHGPMLESIANGFYDPAGESVVALRSLLFNLTTLICEPVMTRLDTRGPLSPVNTQVVGGNLTLVETSIGTSWEVNATGKFLFLEDTGEAAYSIERSLDHMKQAGVFDSAAAVVFGDFTDPDSESLMTLVLQRFAGDETVTCPVFRLTGIGHGRVNFPLPLNTDATITLVDPDAQTYRLCVNNLPQK